MRIRKITTVGAAATAVILGAALPAFADGSQPAAGHGHVQAAHSTSAQADALKAKPKKKVKVYKDAKFKGMSTTFKTNQKTLKSSGWNDAISSAKNQGKRPVTFYATAGYHGAKFSLTKGQSEAHFSNRGLHDTTSSIKFQ